MKKVPLSSGLSSFTAHKKAAAGKGEEHPPRKEKPNDETGDRKDSHKVGSLTWDALTSWKDFKSNYIGRTVFIKDDSK